MNIMHSLLNKDWDFIKTHLDNIPAESYDAQAYFAKGMLLAFGPLHLRHFIEAIICIKTACSLEPGNIIYLVNLSKVYLEIKQPAMALKIAGYAKNIAPANQLAMMALSRAAWFYDRWELAYSALAEAGSLAPAPGLMFAAPDSFAVLMYKLDPLWRQPLTGKRLVLVRMDDCHKDYLTFCRSNCQFQHNYHLFHNPSPAAIERDLRMAKQAPTETKQIHWVIDKSGIPVGLAALVGFDFDNAVAELIIGLPEQREFGVAIEATLLMMEFAFAKIGLQKLIAYVYGDNKNGLRNLLHLGFEQEGLLKSHVVDPVSRQRLDLYVASCLATTFFAAERFMKLTKKLLGRVPEQSHRHYPAHISQQSIAGLFMSL